MTVPLELSSFFVRCFTFLTPPHELSSHSLPAPAVRSSRRSGPWLISRLHTNDVSGRGRKSSALRRLRWSSNWGLRSCCRRFPPDSMIGKAALEVIQTQGDGLGVTQRGADPSHSTEGPRHDASAQPDHAGHATGHSVIATMGIKPRFAGSAEVAAADVGDPQAL